MNTSTPAKAALRPLAILLSASALLTALSFSGCATTVRVESNPPGAVVTIGGKALGSTPTQWQVENTGKPVTVNFTLPGYFPENFVYTAGNNPMPISATLEPTKLPKSFDVVSEPAGASVALNGTAVGAAPVTVPVEFTRDRKDAPWISQRLTVALANYETEMITLTSGLASVPPVALTLLKDARIYAFTATNLDGATLNAEVKLDGKPVGKTPLDLPITYQRSDKTKPWPKFSASVDLPGQYKPAVVELNYTRDPKIPLKLEAITEITAMVYTPEVAMTPVGAQFKFTERATVATLRTSDDSTAMTDLKQVTKFDRQDMQPANRIQTISGFTLTPDGQNAVFALSDVDEAGNRYSNLFIKRADEVSGGVSRLTSGARFFDSQPFIANDGSNYLVFTSNRGDRAKPDIFRVNLVENRLSGGISRLTNDNRFNFQPTYGDSNRQLFYLSVEPAFPKAEVQISSIRFDGSLPTQLPVMGEQINNTHAEKVFFVKIDSDTKKRQIYSITTDGKLETALLNQEDFKKANCFQPYVSADGQRVLFVSDRTGDDKERPNNDIYVVNFDGTNLQRLTYNESDDTLPMWSPTEEGVVYFLSTRGGATNIWRLKLVSGH
jgi:hypothetical protein